MRQLITGLLILAATAHANELPKIFSALSCEPEVPCHQEAPPPTKPTPCKAPEACSTSHMPECLVTPYVELDGEFFDFRRGGGALFFAPAWQCADKLLFVQAHGGFYRDYLYAGSLGLGFREELFPRVGLGLNAFFDAVSSDHGVQYYQGGVGAELFGPWWLGRINGYVPTLKSTFHSLRPLVFGNQIALGGVQDKSYGGIDMEAGVACPTVFGELWGFAGMYIFDACHVKPIVGPQLRAEWRVYDFLCCPGTHLSIGGQYTYDHLHRSQGQLTIRLRLPIGSARYKVCCDKPSHFCRRMQDPVRRQNNIWVERQIARARAAQGGAPLATIWFAQAGAAGKGTQDRPASIEQINAVSREGDIIFLLPYDGPVHGPTIELKRDQRLLGFGSHDAVNIPLPLQQSATVFRQRGLSGVHSAFIPYSDMVGVHAAPDVDIQGIRVEGGSIGILADQGGAISVRDVVLSNQSKAGMVARDGDVLEMTDSYLHDSPHGLRVTNYMVADITKNRFAQIPGNAVWFDGSRRNSSLRVHENSFIASGNSVHSSGSAPAHLAFEKNQTLASGGVSYASRSDHTPYLNITGNTFDEIPHGLAAASIRGSRSHLTITDNHIANSPSATAGIHISAPTDRAIIRDNAITHIGGHAIDVRNELTDPAQRLTLLVERNTIFHTAGSAFHYSDTLLSNGRVHLTLRHNELVNTNGPAIHLDTAEGAKDRIGLSVDHNLIQSPTALHLHAANGPIIDLWPSNNPALIRSDHNILDGEILIEGHIGQLATPPPTP